MVNYTSSFKNNFADMVIDNSSAMVQKVKLGFAIDDCNHVKSGIGLLMVDALGILEIFTEEQKMNFIHLINLYNHV